ncbi:MAG: hypothetical protein Q8Q29_09520, partial [Actinomycetota bacterium]|nr:hypothetical protein [Actinomycetota bacterium]
VGPSACRPLVQGRSVRSGFRIVVLGVRDIVLESRERMLAGGQRLRSPRRGWGRTAAAVRWGRPWLLVPFA